jgi:hypothetical protein
MQAAIRRVLTLLRPLGTGAAKSCDGGPETVDKFEAFMRQLPLLVRILVAVITVSGGLLLITHGHDEVSGSSTQVQSRASGSSATDGLIVLKHEWGAGQAGSRIVRGTVLNRTSRRVVAKIEVALYGPEGRHIGTASAKIDQIEPGAISRFEAAVRNDAAASYKIIGVSAF